VTSDVVSILLISQWPFGLNSQSDYQLSSSFRDGEYLNSNLLPSWISRIFKQSLTSISLVLLSQIEQKARRADRPNRPSDPPPNNFSETPGSRDLSTPAQQPGFPSFNQPSPFDPNVQYQANLAPVYPTSNYASTSQNHQYGPPLFPNVPNDFQAFSWTAEDLLKSALDVDLNFLFGPTPWMLSLSLVCTSFNAMWSFPVSFQPTRTVAIL